MTNSLWQVQDIINITGAQPLGLVPENASSSPITGLVFDNREVNAGNLFLAMPGTVSDGHAFVVDALERGASFALISKPLDRVVEEKFATQLLKVLSVPQALEKLAIAARKRMHGKVVAVTGSAGKTSTKDALYKCLGRVGYAHVSEKSYNNHVGVPISLARMPKGSDFGVFEVGMNHAGEIDKLSSLVKPDVAIITSIGLAHRASFPNLEAIAKAKAEVFNNIAAGGSVILSKECAYYELLVDLAKKAQIKNIITTSLHDQSADVYIERLVSHPNCSCMTANIMGQRLTFKVAMPGEHWVVNSLNILAAVATVGGDLGLSGLVLGELQGVNGRGVHHAIQMVDARFTLIDDSYNANPISMAASLKVLGAMQPQTRMGCRIAVLGDMEELGDISLEAHMDIMGYLENARVQKILGFGLRMAELCAALNKQNKFLIQAQSFSSKSALFDSLKKQIRNGDVVLVKGSNAQKLSDTVASLLALHQSEDEWTTHSSAAE